MAMSRNTDMTAVSIDSYDSNSASLPKKTDKKRKKFHPLRAVRNIFRRKLKRHGSEELFQPTKQSTSSTEFSETDGQNKWYPQHSPPYPVRLSLSHDSIFTPDHNSSHETEEGDTRKGFLASVNNIKFKDELFQRVYRRRGSDDVGLPHSPCTSPTTAEILAQNLQNKSASSQNTCSAGSLISMGSSENDEDSALMLSSSHSSRMSLLDRRLTDSDMDADVSQPVPLNHQAARHKMAVRPKRTHGLPHQRKAQQLTPSGNLPSTPEVTEQPHIVPMAETTESSLRSSQDNVVPDTESKETKETSTPDTKNASPQNVCSDSSIVIPVIKEDPEIKVCHEETQIKVSSGVTKDTKKGGILSRSKSAAAELKIRHEIMQFNRRQQEKESSTKEAKGAENESENATEKIDIKESISCLEETVSGKVFYKNKVNEKKTRKSISAPSGVETKDMKNDADVPSKNDKKPEESFFRRYLFGPRKSNRKSRKNSEPEISGVQHGEPNEIVSECTESLEAKVSKVDSSFSETHIKSAQNDKQPIKQTMIESPSESRQPVKSSEKLTEELKLNGSDGQSGSTPFKLNVSKDRQESEVLEITSTPKDSHRISVIDRIRHLEQKSNETTSMEDTEYKCEKEIQENVSVELSLPSGLEDAKTLLGKINDLSPVLNSTDVLEKVNSSVDSKMTGNISGKDADLETKRNVEKESRCSDKPMQNSDAIVDQDKQYSVLTMEKSEVKTEIDNTSQIKTKKEDESCFSDTVNEKDSFKDKYEYDVNKGSRRASYNDKCETANYTSESSNLLSVSDKVVPPVSPSDTSESGGIQPELFRVFATRAKQSTEDDFSEGKQVESSPYNRKQDSVTTQMEKFNTNIKSEVLSDQQLLDKKLKSASDLPDNQEMSLESSQPNSKAVHLIDHVEDQEISKRNSNKLKSSAQQNLTDANITKEDDKVVSERNNSSDKKSFPLEQTSQPVTTKNDDQLSTKKDGLANHLKDHKLQSSVASNNIKKELPRNQLSKNCISDNLKMPSQEISLLECTTKNTDQVSKNKENNVDKLKIPVILNVEKEEKVQNAVVKNSDGLKVSEQHPTIISHIPKRVDGQHIKKSKLPVQQTSAVVHTAENEKIKKTSISDNSKMPEPQNSVVTRIPKKVEGQLIIKKNKSPSQNNAAVSAQQIEKDKPSKKISESPEKQSSMVTHIPKIVQGHQPVKKSITSDNIKASAKLEQKPSVTNATEKGDDQLPANRNGNANNSQCTSEPLNIVNQKEAQQAIDGNKKISLQRPANEFSPTTIFSTSPTKDTQDGTPPWKQMAQQRREQREQKEKLQMAPTAPCLREIPVKPPKSSKVLDLVSNFQKLQAT